MSVYHAMQHACPLFKPDLQISRIRLTRQVHHDHYRGVVRDLQQLQTHTASQKLVVSQPCRWTTGALAPTL
jgi:hypothetical protein